MNNNVLSKNLKRERLLREWTMRDLEKASGVSSAQISNFENGKRQPRSDTLGKLARALGMSLNELMEEPDSLMINCRSAVKAAHNKLGSIGFETFYTKNKVVFIVDNPISGEDLNDVSNRLYHEYAKYNKYGDSDPQKDLESVSERFLLRTYAKKYRNVKAQAALSIDRLRPIAFFDEDLLLALSSDLEKAVVDEDVPLLKIKDKLRSLEDIMIQEYLKLGLIDEIKKK
ncbi:helix-turn-helix domain-containing protein [Marinilactibacillus psychrotolerans]|uniref:helix-turn-helix domain-containing protein n=1 Tax=Marinilactibacillus psychrotolerans TaxID=191770 RepID=UPI00388B9469